MEQTAQAQCYDLLTPPNIQRGCMPPCDQPNRDIQHREEHPVISFGITKPPAHPEDGDRVSSSND